MPNDSFKDADREERTAENDRATKREGNRASDQLTNSTLATTREDNRISDRADDRVSFLSNQTLIRAVIAMVCMNSILAAVMFLQVVSANKASSLDRQEILHEIGVLKDGLDADRHHEVDTKK